MGGIFSKPKAPPAPPSAAETAEAQARANQVTQFTPQGNLIYGEVDPATGQFMPFAGAEAQDRKALKVEETAFQKALREGGESEVLRLLGEFQGRDPLQDVRSASGIESGLMPGASMDFAAETKRLEDATFNAVTQRLQPQFEQQRRLIEQRLADQGLPIGSEAYQEEINRLEESQNEQLAKASFDAVSAGRAEQDRLARLSSALRGQGLNEQLALSGLESQSRAQQFGELGALLGFNSPFQAQNVIPVDVAGITNSAYANQLAGYQMQQQAAGQRAQNFAQLGGAAAFLMSDINSKENIKFVETQNGFNVYEFNYKGDNKKYKGVIAQEIEITHPHAVKEINGFKHVCYDAIGVCMEAA